MKASAAAQSGLVRWAELGAPLADRLVADDDAALGEEILDVAKAEVEAKVQPDGVGDHVGREAVATVGRRLVGGATGHRASLPAAQLDNSPSAGDAPISISSAQAPTQALVSVSGAGSDTATTAGDRLGSSEACDTTGGRMLYVGLNSWIPAETGAARCQDG